jgi:hypothetical protein
LGEAVKDNVKIVSITILTMTYSMNLH